MTNRELLILKVDTLTELEAAEVLEYISIMQSLNESIAEPDCRHLLALPLFPRFFGVSSRWRREGWRGQRC